MKFKASFTDYGVHLLERRLVPAFEKVGRVCHVYLTRDRFSFLHNILNADGVQAFAHFNKDILFDNYRISSQNNDSIAFTIDLTLLLRALRSNVSMDGEKLVVKLVKKRPVTTDRPMPYLTFESKGYKSAIIQDVPVSDPLSRFDVCELQSALDLAQELPQTLVQAPDLHQLQFLIDRLKNVGEVLDVGVTQYGDLHLQISTPFVKIGMHFENLKVVGVQASSSSDKSISSSEQLEKALQRGEASAVKVSIKHFGKSIHCYLTKPDATFYGIAGGEACMVVIFQFLIPGTQQTDSNINLHCRLPVLDRGS